MACGAAQGHTGFLHMGIVIPASSAVVLSMRAVMPGCTQLGGPGNAFCF